MLVRASFILCLLLGLFLSAGLASSVTGVVTLEGHPVIGVEVYLLGTEDSHTYDATTSADGTFTITDLPEWKQLHLVVFLPSLMLQTSHTFTLSGNEKPLVINLELKAPVASVHSVAASAPVMTTPAVSVDAEDLQTINYAVQPDSLKRSPPAQTQ